MDLFLRCLFLMHLCYAMFAGVSAIPTPQAPQNVTTSSISNIPISFTGGHWFDKPNLITFFVRTDDTPSDDAFPNSIYLVMGDERTLISSPINHVEGIGSYKTSKYIK